MLFSNSLTYGVLGILGGISLIKSLSENKSMTLVVLINIILGGSIYALLNIMGMNINLNIITGACIGILGVPGVFLIVVLKLLFHLAI